MTGKGSTANSAAKERAKWLKKQRINLVRLAVGAGILAAAAVGLAVFVPRRRWVEAAAPFRAAMKLPVAAAVDRLGGRAVERVTAPSPPVFDDLRPFDEF